VHKVRPAHAGQPGEVHVALVKVVVPSHKPGEHAAANQPMSVRERDLLLLVVAGPALRWDLKSGVSRHLLDSVRAKY
jgi:hypothetical protein